MIIKGQILSVDQLVYTNGRESLLRDTSNSDNVTVDSVLEDYVGEYIIHDTIHNIL